MILFSRSWAGRAAVVVLAGIHLLIERQRQLQHFGASLRQLGLGFGQQLRRLDGSLHHVAKLGRVPFFAQPPGAAIGGTLRQIVLHPRVEVGQRLLGGRRYFVVLRFERRTCRDIGGHRVHQIEIAFVLSHRRRDEDGIGVRQLRLGLIEEARNLADARDHVAHANFLRRVLLRQRQKQPVADQLHVSRRVVLVILDLVELEQVERDLVVDQAVVGGVLRVQTRDRRLGLKALSPLAIELLLGGNSLRAHVVELRVEIDRLAGLGIEMLVVTSLRGAHGRERQRVFHELVGHLGELRVDLMGMAHAIGGFRLCRAEDGDEREKQKNAQSVFHSASKEEKCKPASINLLPSRSPRPRGRSEAARN